MDGLNASKNTGKTGGMNVTSGGTIAGIAGGNITSSKTTGGSGTAAENTGAKKTAVTKTSGQMTMKKTTGRTVGGTSGDGVRLSSSQLLSCLKLSSRNRRTLLQRFRDLFLGQAEMLTKLRESEATTRDCRSNLIECRLRLEKGKHG